MSEDPRATGSCLCGTIRFAVHGPLRPIVVCHCMMCQRAGGAASVTTECLPGDFEILSGRPKWYRSSPNSRRGFCAKCGSLLFWEPADGSHISISAGSLDQPTGLRIGEHIFTDHKADYDRAPPLPPEEVVPWKKAGSA